MKKTILTLTFLSCAFLFSSAHVLAAPCGFTCWNSVCPDGTNAISGDCPSGQTCCAGSPTNYGGGTLPVYNSNGNLSTPQGSQGTTSTGGGNFVNPLGNNSTIEMVLGNIYNYLVNYVVGPLAVIFIIIGGIMYMLSGGSKEAAERAKKTIIYAIVGLAIVVVSKYFYDEIKLMLTGSGNAGSQLQLILLSVLRFLLSIVGFLAIISMVIGAIWMFTAVGDEERYELGKKTAAYSILGLVIALAALIIAQQVTILVGGGSSAINNAANSPAMGSTPGTPAVPNSAPTLPGTQKI